MDLVTLNGRDHQLDLNDEEARIVEALAERPMSLHELAVRTSSITWQFIPLARLEEAHVVQRCGLTPTDLLHAAGRLALWNAAASLRACDLFARLTGRTREQFVEEALRQVVWRLALELLKKEMAEELDPEQVESSPAAMALLRKALGEASDAYDVQVTLKRPVVGIGAPAYCFVPQAAELLHTRAVIPPEADVANAVGAITSPVFIHKQVRIAPDELGRYALAGLPGTPAFANFDEAHRFAVDELQKIVRQMAHEAGTSQTKVEIVVDDGIAELSDGSPIFVGRTLEGRLSGRPDLARLATEAARR